MDLAELRAAAARLGFVLMPADPAPEVLDEIHLVKEFSHDALRVRYRAMVAVAEKLGPGSPRTDGGTFYFAGHPFTARDLLGRVMRNLDSTAPRYGAMRWVLARELFGTGSTVSNAICREFGYDPDEKVKPR